MPCCGTSHGSKGRKTASDAPHRRKLIMCGICGIFQHGNLPPIDERLLVAMRDTLTHRGPDAAGIWISPSRDLGLAHRRLSIVDLNPSSAQPMANEDGSVIVVFNGEIYNHRDLRKELVAAGHLFRTDHADTEVLVHGYEEWGWEGLLMRLRGMFAIALWDTKERALFLARDRIGIKPLYLYSHNGRLIFASEIKAILRAPYVQRAVDPHALYHYLTGMVAPAPMTLFQGIQKLPAGCYVRVGSDGRGDFRRYWHVATGNVQTTFRSHGEAVEGIRVALDDAVSEHLAADVPVGIFLSGGVDSGTLLAKMSAQTTEQIRTFSVGYEGYPELDERQQAREMAQRFGAMHQEVLVTQRSLEDSWEQILYHQDEPLADWVCLPLFHVARLASQEVKVVLVGEGADEIFAGYSGYLRYLNIYNRLWSPYRHHVPAALRALVARAAEQFAKSRTGKATSLDFLVRAGRDRECFWGGAVTFWETQKQSLLIRNAFDSEPWATGLIDDNAIRVFDSNAVMVEVGRGLDGLQADQLARMINLELAYRLPELLLMRVDKMTMAHSLEARVPFLDHRLVELAFGLPTTWKIVNRVPKAILKDAVRGVIPDAVIDRPKVGFGAPVAEWLKGEFGHRVESEIAVCALFKSGWFDSTYIRKMFQAHRSGHGNFATNLWVLYNLAGWYNRWIEPAPFSADRQ